MFIKYNLVIIGKCTHTHTHTNMYVCMYVCTAYYPMTYSDVVTYIWKLSLPEQNEKEETLTTNVWIEIVSVLHNLPGASHTNCD